MTWYCHTYDYLWGSRERSSVGYLQYSSTWWTPPTPSVNVENRPLLWVYYRLPPTLLLSPAVFRSPSVLPLLGAGKGHHLLIYSLPERDTARQTQYAYSLPFNSSFVDTRSKIATVITIISDWRVVGGSVTLLAAICTATAFATFYICIFRCECLTFPYSRFPLFMHD